MTGTTDYTAQGYNPTANVQFTGTENESPGLWIMQGLNIISFSGSSSYAEYPIDSQPGRTDVYRTRPTRADDVGGHHRQQIVAFQTCEPGL